MENTKKTCLYDKHLALNAKMMPFGGFDMPLEYKTIIEEHNAVRNHAGIFDVSHMGEILISGPDSEKYINHIFTNDIGNAPSGKIFYGIMLYPHSEGFDITIDNQSEQYGEVAVQGPEAWKIIERLLKISVNDLSFYTFKEILYNGEKIIISRTGYTGEDGFELYGSPKFINYVWDTLVNSNKVQPCGLGCRDTLRFEVALPLYGHELSEDITPLEAGLGSFVKLDKEEFIGKGSLALQKTEGIKRKIVGIELFDKAIPRNGYEVYANGKNIGYVTTGYNSISTGKSVCMALIDQRYSALDTDVEIHIRKKFFPGKVVKKRFYQKNYKK